MMMTWGPQDGLGQGWGWGGSIWGCGDDGVDVEMTGMMW